MIARAHPARLPRTHHHFGRGGGMEKQLMIPGIGGVLCGKLVIDLFAGLGGASTGIEIAVRRAPDVAVNHNRNAIALHEINHPGTRHFCDDVRSLKPRQLCGDVPVGLLWLSPDCRHFSRSLGAAPVSASVRALAWEAVTWAKEVRPDIINLENVPEFLTWSPLIQLCDEGGTPQFYTSGDLGGAPKMIPDPDRLGETFQAWVQALRDLGYVVDWRVLNAADFGAPTNRHRLYVQARCDGRPLLWPAPTHGPGRLSYGTAASCMDWSVPSPSIFSRKKPLVLATCQRVARGLVRQVLNATPFVAPSQTGDDCFGFLTKCYSSKDGRQHHSLSLQQPLSTITQIDHHGLVLSPAVPFVLPVGVRDHGHCKPVRVHAPLRRAGERAAQVRSRYGDVWADAVRVARFLCRHAEGVAVRWLEFPGCGNAVPVVVVGHGDRLQVLTDISLRLLVPRELARGQGFPDSYVLQGTQTEQKARVGNSVCPPVARALVGAQFGTWPSIAA